jgi:hypothetical protein
MLTFIESLEQMNIHQFTPKKREPNSIIVLTASKKRGDNKFVKFNMEIGPLTDNGPQCCFHVSEDSNAFELSVRALVTIPEPGMHQIELHPEAATEALCSLVRFWELDMSAAFNDDEEYDDE